MSSSPEARLLTLVSGPDYVPMRLEEAAKALRLDNREIKTLRRTLQELLADGRLVRIKGDKLAPPALVDLVTGVVRFSAGGSAKLFPEAPADGAKPASPDPIHIHAEDTAVALHGDTVVARLNPPNRMGGARGDLRTGRIIRILKRANDLVPGTLKKERLFWYVVPDDPRIPRDILVPEPDKAATDPRPTLDDKVVVKLGEWERRDLNPTGDIVEVLGRTHTPMAEYKAILRKYRLNPEFPADVMAEVAALPTVVPESDTVGRRDFRNILTLTIDPDDAKDFDDALSIERLPGGLTRVGIHIADVSAYVRTGSALDKEAAERGNSTYLVGTVVPMLPHALSNGLCSLVEGEDRLTKAILLTLDADAQIVRSEAANTVIRSRKRLTYKQAYGLMTVDDFAAIRALPSPPPHQTGSPGRPLASLSDAELAEARDAIRDLWRIAARLRADRFRKGSLDLEMTETKIYCDAEGYAERAEIVEHDESHQLVEEFMLAANESVARMMREANLPHLSRVHDEPDAEKLADLRQELLGSGIRTGDLNKREEVVKLLKLIRDLPNGLPLRIRFLRSLKQACYRAEADGHYGLAKRDYSHFTSPIRRYADLVEHRVFDEHLVRAKLPTAPAVRPKHYTPADLTRIADHISITERNSADAERDSVKVKILELFEREAAKARKAPFEGVIVDIRNHGFNVELSVSQAYGLVHLSSMEDDFYNVMPDGTLRGRRTRKTYTLGDKVLVTVDRVDRYRRQIDFRLVGPVPQAGAAPAPAALRPTGALQGKVTRGGGHKPRREDSGAPRAARHEPAAPAGRTGAKTGGVITREKPAKSDERRAPLGAARPAKAAPAPAPAAAEKTGYIGRMVKFVKSAAGLIRRDAPAAAATTPASAPAPARTPAKPGKPAKFKPRADAAPAPTSRVSAKPGPGAKPRKARDRAPAGGGRKNPGAPVSGGQWVDAPAEPHHIEPKPKSEWGATKPAAKPRGKSSK